MTDEELHALPFTHDPFSDWIDAHRDEMARHVGRLVVIDPARGIIDVGDCRVELHRKHGRGREVLITYVAADLYGGPPA